MLILLFITLQDYQKLLQARLFLPPPSLMLTYKYKRSPPFTGWTQSHRRMHADWLLLVSAHSDMRGRDTEADEGCGRKEGSERKKPLLKENVKIRLHVVIKRTQGR